MGTINYLLVGVCLAAIVGNRSTDRNLLRQDRQQIVSIAITQIGVKEMGNNKGYEVAKYLQYVRLNTGYPWCAAFVSWVFGKAGYGKPRSAWSPDLFPSSKRIAQAHSAAVFGIYFSSLKRIAHCGIVEKVQHNWIVTIEGNTNVAGNREGDGVYRKRRHIKTIACLANWMPAKKGGQP